jgi:GT2 family glycosyltransferase
MITRKCLETIGLFDPRYFAYLEDMDLSMRVRKYGWKIVYVPTSILWHKNAGSTSRPGNDFHQYYMTRNRLLFGLLYASTRTKIALIRESLKHIFSGTPPQKHATIDALLGKWGKQFDWKK